MRFGILGSFLACSVLGCGQPAVVESQGPVRRPSDMGASSPIIGEAEAPAPDVPQRAGRAAESSALPSETGGASRQEPPLLANGEERTPASCPPAPPRAGFEDCVAVELTGAPPCEAICRRASNAGAASRCCPHPVEVVVLRGKRVLLRVPACDFVPPDCADHHGHGNMDSHLRILAGSPPDIVVVEGGCEMRAMMHGYVPPGVASWSGCVHHRYRWNGVALERQPASER